MTLYFVVGWSGLMLIPQMLRDGFGLLGFILLGGAVYSLGMIPFALKRGPSHFIWHFFVLLGAVVQWLGIYLYIYC
jgi:hemolysin III